MDEATLLQLRMMFRDESVTICDEIERSRLNDMEKLNIRMGKIMDDKIAQALAHIAQRDSSGGSTGSPEHKKMKFGPSVRTTSVPPISDVSGGIKQSNPKMFGFSGLPQHVLKSVLTKLADEFLSKVPSSAKIGARCTFKPIDTSFGIAFASASLCKGSYQAFRYVDIEWVSPVSKEAYKIRARPDRTSDQRKIFKCLGSLYGQIKGTLDRIGQCKPEFQLGTTGLDGCLFLQASETLVYELFYVKKRSALGDDWKVAFGTGLGPLGLGLDCANVMDEKAFEDLARVLGAAADVTMV